MQRNKAVSTCHKSIKTSEPEDMDCSSGVKQNIENLDGNKVTGFKKEDNIISPLKPPSLGNDDPFDADLYDFGE